jgi:misacylated tRNA(Ala) deacylase
LNEPYYLRDAYARALDTWVESSHGARVRLRDTLLYPGGGGQLEDWGALRRDGEAHPVRKHAKEPGAVWHELDDGTVMAPGPVRVEVDWPRRYGVMRYHSAVHVLCGVVYQLFGATVTGNQIYPDRARMDFALADLNPERVAAIEREANAVIGRGLDISATSLPRAEFERHDLIRTAKNLVPAHLETVRVVEIAGFDAQADGGTHVRNTSEIGTLRVTKTENKGKINRRLEIVLDPT